MVSSVTATERGTAKFTYDSSTKKLSVQQKDDKKHIFVDMFFRKDLI